MSRTLHELFDGPILTPLKESERWPGYVGTHEMPERMASGNLPDQPADLPRKPLGTDSMTPWKNLRTGR